MQAPAPFPASSFRARRRGLPGFTLIELLTVIAIIGILASIVIGSVGAVRARARDASNIANLRSIGMATHLFANDNRGRLPVYDNYKADGSMKSAWGPDAGRTSPIRCLFSPGSIDGGTHPMGGGDYLRDTKACFSPHLSADYIAQVTPKSFPVAADGRPRIGYCLWSFPVSEPAAFNGQVMTNDRLSGWGRTPLYSDLVNAAQRAEAGGFNGKRVSVVHLDGSASSRPLATADTEYAKGWSGFVYYLATGVRQ